MAEAAILGIIQHLESSYANTYYNNLEFRIKKLRGMLDFLSDLKMEEERRPKYLMADLLELAQEVADSRYITDYWFDTYHIEIELTKMRIINFGADDKNDREEDEEVVVGLEKDVRKLIDKVLLNDLCSDHTWIIKGMAGIGKTTLARQVYNHKDVVGWFEHRAWVSITSDKSNKEILVDLIQQMAVGSEELFERDYLLEEKDNRSLRKLLLQHLEGKRYLMVFDNMLRGMNLGYIFRDIDETGKYHEDCGSRELWTSRFSTSIGDSIHNMKPLDVDTSWQLFLKTIDKFTSIENKFSKDLERKGKEMLKKCGGLPLAIIDVGRQKAKERLSGIEWEELFDSIDLSESLKKLEPMYDELDEDFKACFLHMSFFKENAIMREEKLEQIWAASGLYPLTTLEERYNGRGGTCYVLLKESIIEGLNGTPRQREVKRCRMNPLLHMLSVKKAEEEIGLEILNSNRNSKPSQNPRHRVVHCGREKFNHSKNHENKQLISLIFHGGGGYLEDVSPSYWESFELLKILDLEDFGVKIMSESIGTLTKLRYLGLRNNYLTRIPRSLGDLENLEVLDIDLNFMVEVPDIIGEMGSLRNLYMSDVIFRHPLKIDTLENLETLTNISIYDWAYEVSGLETLNRLVKLGIEDIDENLDVGKLFASLAKLWRLRRLILRGPRFTSMPCLDEIGVFFLLERLRLDGRLDRLPSASNFPRSLHHLILANTCLEDDPMPILEKLRVLRRLKLQNAFTGREMVIQDKGFSSLRFLSINELWNLRNIKVGRRALPFLVQLEINNCPRLETIPEEIGSMKDLEEFKMVTTKHIATKIRASGLTSNIVEVDIVP
ncbi:probable disease resistance protein At1g58602 [Salvia hispanica]|uniref:probable disease resistance protein At1g58602 n=1 Tax=Salvia hispanica TaxID=49212 RepID=UPI00200997A3|nr:probable disease resistance protein At1g58602 [Salvia hispanica]XP_047946380.1 probable disease resistance protein At1g58602 [Salvia hispanica]